jgi:hypothetical protein
MLVKKKCKKNPNSFELGFFFIGRQLPTLPDITLVPSAQPGLTSLFEMGRGGPWRYSHHNILILFDINCNEYI